MKKFIFILCAAFLTFALVLGFITYNKTTQALLSVNIEALTNNENEETSNKEVITKVMAQNSIMNIYRENLRPVFCFAM